MTIDELLRAAATVDEPTAEALANGQRQVAAEAERLSRQADQVRLTHRAAGRARTRRLRRPLTAALVAGAASLAFVAAPSLNLLGTGLPASSASAAAVLRQAAVSAGEQDGGGWQDAAYWHSVSTYRRGGQDFRREIWLGHRDPGVLRDEGVESSRLLPLGIASFAAGGTSLSWDDLYRLPVEAEPLEQRLREGIKGAGPDDDTELFVIVGDLLRESPAPPALRRALWEVAARVPGVVLVGPGTDAAGRTGTAVRRGDHTYLVESTTGRLLQESSGDPDSPPHIERDEHGRVLSVSDRGHRATYLEQGPASAAPRG